MDVHGKSVMDAARYSGRRQGRMAPKMPLTFHMTQALVLHKSFQRYLHRMVSTASALSLSQ